MSPCRRNEICPGGIICFRGDIGNLVSFFFLQGHFPPIPGEGLVILPRSSACISSLCLTGEVREQSPVPVSAGTLITFWSVLSPKNMRYQNDEMQPRLK